MPVAVKETPLKQTSVKPTLDCDALIRLDHVSVALNGQRVLHDVTWSLRRSENWAVLGPNGAGKSTFLRLLRGEIWPAPVNGGMRTYAFDGAPTQSPIGVKQRMAIVSAEQQQRYTRVHGRKYGDDFGHFITVRDIVFTGLLDSELVTRKPKPAEAVKVKRVMQAVGIDDLADVPFDKLSQGQLRKALIARAVIGEPDVLILDEVGVGLDARSRRAVLDMIQRVANPTPQPSHGDVPSKGGAGKPLPSRGGVGGGVQILMTTHRRDELIPAITNVLEIRHGRITAESRRNAESYQKNSANSASPRWQSLTDYQVRTAQPFLLNIVNASVALDEGAKVVLHDVTWRMSEGEHWMIVGDNGVGKSALLKLILGELWSAQGGSIERFNRSDFTNVWEIKKRIGYVSADLQARYHHDLSTEQVIATGFSASVGWLQRTTKAQDKRVQAMIDLFGLRPLAKRSILEMSYGQARKVLVARALVASPKLLILDEVFDGLDAHFRAELTEILEGISRDAGIILVSHHEADCLPCITHRMFINGGRIVRQEQRI